MTPIAPARRFAIAALALLCAAALFRGNVAASLVTRGDDALRSGSLDAAIARYSRATLLDPRSPVAVDRLAFALLSRRAKGDAQLAFDRVDAALRETPRDATLLGDRAYAAERLGRWRTAERDFASAAELAREPRYAHLAARMAQRASDPRAGRVHLRAALAIDRNYAPARILLARFER